MKRFNILSWAMAVLLVVVLAPTTMAAGLPDLGEGDLSVLDNGREYIRWNMKAEYERVHLTLSTPCGVIERTYEAGEDPVFELAELEPDDPTGSYNWQLRIEPYVDPSVREALNDARAKNDYEAVRALRRKGLLPEGPFIQSGFFSVDREGGIVDFTQVEKEGLRADINDDGASEPGRNLGVVTGESIGLVTEEQVISGDLVVYNSICVGFDCPTNPTFGADTIRLQENNLRIHADDTSTASSFPNQDWRLEFNSNLNGGGEYFRVIDATANRNIMTIEANAPSHSLYVESSGELGIGTANPVLEVHAVSGDTPGLRLQQDTSSGFGAQVWDLAGNETNFFIRDATNGSTLPFRVFPGSSSSSLVVRDSQVGVATSSPQELLHVSGSENPRVLIQDTTDNANDKPGFILRSPAAASSGDWFFEVDNGGNFQIDFGPSSGPEILLTDSTATNSAVTINGDLTVQGIFSNPSSRTLKTAVEPVDESALLERLAQLPITEWTYLSDVEERRHIGPFTEDFQEAFGLGTTGKNIIPLDVQGVTIAAVKALNNRVTTLQEQNSLLLKRLAALEANLSQVSTADGTD